MREAPGTIIWTALFWVLILGVVFVLARPSLRSRRWLVWIVVGGVALLLVGSLIWTYMV